MIIETENMLFGYQSPLTNALNFKLCAGEILCLVGENGSGKSTLLKTLAGFIPPLSGEIKLQGKFLKTYKFREIAKQVAFVHFEHSYPIELNVYDYVSLGRTPYSNFLDKRSKTDEELIEFSLEKMDIKQFAKKKIIELSDGEKSRVFLARALAQQVKLLLLDEPDAFLDIPRRKNLFNDLRQIAVDNQIGIILSTHWVEYGEKYCDKILAFKSNREIQIANAKEARKFGLLDWTL